MGKISTLKLSQLLTKNLKLPPGKEPYSDGFVIAGVRVFERVLSLPHAKKVLDNFDNLMMAHNPLESVWCINAFVDRCGTQSPHLISGSLQLMYDAFIEDYVTCSDMRSTKLKDKHSSVIEIFKIQLQFRKMIFDKDAPFDQFEHITDAVFAKILKRCGKNWRCWN